MINYLYQIVNKGSFRALSLLLALISAGAIFTHTALFAIDLGGISPIFTLIIFWSVMVLFIHGMGLEIKSAVWKLCFFPLIAYPVNIAAIIFIVLKH